MKVKAPEMRRARIEIVPMIDTIFFLLVFFMIAWLTMVKMNGLGVPLPRQNRSPGHAPHAITLSVSEAGRFFLNARQAPDWPQELRAALLSHPGSVVVLNVAPTQKTQELISLLDAVKGVIVDSHIDASVLIASPRTRSADTDRKGTH